MKEFFIKNIDEREISTLDNFSFAFFRIDNSDNLIYANKYLLKLLDYTSFEELISNINLNPSLKYCFSFKRLSKSDCFENEFTWITKHNTKKIFKEIVQKVNDENEIAFIDCVIKDVTEKKFLENLIKDINSKEASILKAIPDYILVVSKNFEIIDTKNNVSKIFPDFVSIKGLHIKDLFDETISNKLEKIIKEVIETSEQINGGFDLGLFRNSLTLSIDAYSKRTKDLLAVPIKAVWTDEVPYYNVGRIDNNGIEMELTYTQRESEFKYTVKFSGTYQTNEVKEFSAAKLQGYSAHGAPAEETAFEVGQPVWYFRGYKALGVFQSWEEIRNYTYTDPETGKKTLIQPDAVPGDVKIADVGGRLDPNTGKPTLPDGKIDANDFTKLGKPLPTFLLGLNFDCAYKGFDFNMFWYAELDKEIYNNILRNDFLHLNRPEYFYTERWTPNNHTNDWFRARYQDATTGSTQIGFNSFFFEDGSFLRLKNIQLGYTLPSSISQRFQISKLRIYVGATNLITITKYKGSDPEIGVTGDVNSYGVDRGMYPAAKTFTVGMNLSF